MKTVYFKYISVVGHPVMILLDERVLILLLSETNASFVEHLMID